MKYIYHPEYDLRSMAMEQVCVITSEIVSDAANMHELPAEITSEAVMRDQVLDAHRTLMRTVS